MRGLALASLRHRATAFTATFVSMALGTLLIGSFATLTATSFGDVTDTDAETLRIMGLVIGGWGSVIVLSAVASTVGIVVAQRAGEVALLRVIGATPAQVRRLVRLETAVVAVLAAALGALAAVPAGGALLALLRRADMVDDGVRLHGAPVAAAGCCAALLVVSWIATAVTSRRTIRGPVASALADAAGDAGRLRWWRVLLGLVLLSYGVVMAVVTITVTADSPDPYAAMSTSGAAGIVVAVGMACLGPFLLRVIARGLTPLAGAGGSPARWLAAFNATNRSHLLAGVLGPVIVLTATAVGTLGLVAIDHRTLGSGYPEGDLINLLNNLVTGMIVLFAAIMVLNTSTAVTAGRHRELTRLHLLGATRSEVERSVLAEAWIVALVGAALGVIASLATIVPFSVARSEGVVPDGQLWQPPLLVAGAVLITLGSARAAIRRSRALTSPVR